MFFISRFPYKYGVIGGDLRQKLILEELSDHENCCHYGVAENPKNSFYAPNLLTLLKTSENIIFPLPMFKGENLNIATNTIFSSLELLSVLRNHITPNQKIFGGCIPPDFCEIFQKKNVVYFDFMEQRTISIFNSIATAEGLIAEMILSTSENLHGKAVLILGYGTCAKTLAAKLQALQMRTCICARNQASLMEAFGYGHCVEPLSNLKKIIPGYPMIVNTIPAKVLPNHILDLVSPKAWIYEIASFPYGMDLDYAKKRKLNVKLCMSLPGKYAPDSSADILTDFVLKNTESNKSCNL